MRVAPYIAFIALWLASARVLGQDDEQAGTPGRQYTTTAVLIPEAGADLADATVVGIGLRRGVRQLERLRYEDPSDILGAESMPEDLMAAIDDLDPIADMVRSGDPHEAGRRAEAAIEVFEDHLEHVKRSVLVDAYMLRALAECQQRRRRECLAGFEYVITFREGADYDTGRYPPQFAGMFDRVREQLLERGARGSIRITTDPPGAEVFVDGRSYGPSPATVLGLLTGKHYVTVKATRYEKVIQRVEVFEDHEESYAIELHQNPRALLLTQQIGQIREELGRPRAGPAIGAMDGYLFTNHVMIGIVRPAPGNQLDVRLYLYHQTTEFLLSEKRGTISADEAGMVLAEDLVRDLYEGIDLTGAVEAPEQELVVDEPSPFWQQWWFWTAIGVVIVSGVVVLSVAGGDDGGPPEGFTRIEPQWAR